MGKNNKWLRCGLWIVAIGLLGYNSVYIKKLSDVKASRNKDFDATAYAGALWEEKLPARLDSAVSLQLLISALRTDAPAAFSRYTHALDLGNVRYGLVKAAGKVISVNEDEVDVLIKAAPPGPAASAASSSSPGPPVIARLATEYIYGNAIRDASGLVDIKDFTHTMDLDNIAAALDKRVRESVLPAFKAAVKKEDSVSFTGAIELNKEHLTLNELNITPIELKIIRN